MTPDAEKAAEECVANECHAIREERDALNAEVERLRTSLTARDEKDVQIEKLKTEVERLTHKFDGQYAHDTKALDAVHRERDTLRAMCEKMAEALQIAVLQLDDGRHRQAISILRDQLTEYRGMK
jgi:hypothetical protein